VKLAVDRDRWVALGLLLAVLAVAYGVLVHPWWTVPLLDVEQRIDGLRERDLRLRMQVKQAPQVQARLNEVMVRQAGSPGFLTESSAELATAGLVQRLETVVAEASPGNRSCAITNRSPLTEPSRERYARVVVQVRLSCGAAELARVLHALESGSPRLFVGNLNMLIARNYFTPGSGAGGSESREGGMDVNFDLYGYLRPSAAPATPAATRTPEVTGAD